MKKMVKINTEDHKERSANTRIVRGNKGPFFFPLGDFKL